MRHPAVLGDLDSLQPLLFDLIDLQKISLRILFKVSTEQLVEDFLGPVQQAGLQVVLTQFGQGLQTNSIVEIRQINQVLVHADSTLRFATSPEQVAKSEMQFDRLRIDLGHFEKRVNGLVRLLIEQEIQALKI